MTEPQNERVNYGWVVGSAIVGLILGALAFFGQYWVNWSGAPVEALISIGTAVMLAAALYFLQRRFVVEVRMEASRTAESVADARVAERVKEVNARLDELGHRMDQIASERRQRQDAAVESMHVPTFDSVATALAEANKLAAIVDGQLRVQGSRDRDELALDFSWIRDMGDDRFQRPQRDALEVKAHIYADERVQGGRPVIETTWKPDEPAERVGMRLREQLERAGRWRGEGTLDWPLALRNLQDSLGLAIRSRRKDGTGWLSGALYELVTEGWAITDDGVERAGYGVVLPEDEFPDVYAEGSAAMERRENWPPKAPQYTDQGVWDAVLQRGQSRFPLMRGGPFRSAPRRIPLTEPPSRSPA